MVQSQPVQAFMTTPVKFVHPDTPLTEVIQMLDTAHISGLAVCDHQGRLVGEISAKDLMVRESGLEPGPYVVFLDSVIYLRNPLRWEREVHQALGETAEAVMSSSPHTCGPTTSLQAAAALLHDAGTERLFVVERGELIGVFSRADLIRAMAAKDGAQ
ncbi:MAG: CBS domain-containing protein [Synechococcus sp. SB0673_bin_10]|nr:CBS domain-containing protein [Synechococcus sp. SB0667_bin_8]MYG63485.1 CBS domain-containing protein [Synechococcus sp. SB0675_bin_7]MYI71819.1 CBS domain-containing protein [Synechococcus sp. SB0673_bin_10]MYK84972.1 CBS domain-containing protein [Synechococcus sp. SB0669_bin_7]